MSEVAPGKEVHGDSQTGFGALACRTSEAEGKEETKQDLLTGLFASSLLPPSFLLYTVAARKQKSDHDNPLLKSIY